MMQKWILISGLFLVCNPGYSQDKTNYIQLYKTIAVSEMMRTGIPASIKLAQAILESNCGKSELACEANNHFGIKCGNDWSGKSFQKEDDDYEDGKLVKSCFREFRNVYDSYIAHSDFLTDPNKAKRYGSLFDLEPIDYKGWAKGLSKAGYATDPEYASRLINIIELYRLHEFDTDSEEQFASVKPERSTGYNLARYHNDVKYALAMTGDNASTIAKRHDVTVRQIVRYNDDIENEDQEIKAGARVYLQPKRNQNQGKQKVHLLKPGEDLVIVSQHYGIKLSALLKRNGLQQGEIPAPNQKIALKGKTDKALRTIDHFEKPTDKLANKSSTVSDQNTALASTTKVIDVAPKKMTYDTGAVKIVKPASSRPSHVVAKGDTLFGIATQHGISVTELKKMNNLSADTIFIGQKLLLR